MNLKRSHYSHVIDCRYCMGLLLGLFILAGCRTGNKSNPDTPNNASVPAVDGDYFQEIGQQIGLDFVHSIGGPELMNIVESSCGGTAFLDYDQDGYIDIYVTSGTWIEGFTKSEKPEQTAWQSSLPEQGRRHL